MKRLLCLLIGHKKLDMIYKEGIITVQEPEDPASPMKPRKYKFFLCKQCNSVFWEE